MASDRPNAAIRMLQWSSRTTAVLNSNLGIWFLSSVVFGAISYFYGEHAARVADRVKTVETIRKLQTEIMSRGLQASLHLSYLIELNDPAAEEETNGKVQQVMRAFVGPPSQFGKEEHAIYATYPDYRDVPLMVLVNELLSLSSESERRGLVPTVQGVLFLSPNVIQRLNSTVALNTLVAMLDVDYWSGAELRGISKMVSDDSSGKNMEEFVKTLGIRDPAMFGPGSTQSNAAPPVPDSEEVPEKAPPVPSAADPDDTNSGQRGEHVGEDTEGTGDEQHADPDRPTTVDPEGPSTGNTEGEEPEDPDSAPTEDPDGAPTEDPDSAPTEDPDGEEPEDVGSADEEAKDGRVPPSR